MLLQVRDTIRQARMMSVQQLARHLGIDESTLQPMLDLWVKKGVIKLYTDASECNRSCGGCHSGRNVLYQVV